MSVVNSRSKRSVPDIGDDPDPGYDAQEYSSIVASTSTLDASPCTKRGTPLPLLLVPVALYRLSSCHIRSEACRDA
jgi:hypothetical protein